jgi:hypothetical protein
MSAIIVTTSFLIVHTYVREDKNCHCYGTSNIQYFSDAEIQARQEKKDNPKLAAEKAQEKKDKATKLAAEKAQEKKDNATKLAAEKAQEKKDKAKLTAEKAQEKKDTQHQQMICKVCSIVI